MNGITKLTPRLPASVEDMDDRLTFKRGINVNDRVHALFRGLWKEDEAFRDLINAGIDSDCITGSVKYNHFVATQMIQDFAKANDRDPFVAAKNLTTIGHALVIVRNRYHVSIRELRATLGDEIVPDTDDPTASGNEDVA